LTEILKHAEQRLTNILSDSRSAVEQSASPPLTTDSQSPVSFKDQQSDQIRIFSTEADLDDTIPWSDPNMEDLTEAQLAERKAQVEHDNRMARDLARAEQYDKERLITGHNQPKRGNKPPLRWISSSGQVPPEYTRIHSSKDLDDDDDPSYSPFQIWTGEGNDGQGNLGAGGAPDGDDNDTKTARLMAKMLTSEHGISRAINKISSCDGMNPEKTLQWVREMDTLPQAYEIAPETSTGFLQEFVRNSQTPSWPTLKEAIIRTFISPAFAETQRDALQNLRQRPGESLLAYIHQFKTLAREAYPEPPEDQNDLIRLFLSSLNDRNMARSIAKKRLPTLQHVVEKVQEEAEAESFETPALQTCRQNTCFSP